MPGRNARVRLESPDYLGSTREVGAACKARIRGANSKRWPQPMVAANSKAVRVSCCCSSRSCLADSAVWWWVMSLRAKATAFRMPHAPPPFHTLGRCAFHLQQRELQQCTLMSEMPCVTINDWARKHAGSTHLRHATGSFSRNHSCSGQSWTPWAWSEYNLCACCEPH